VVRGKRLGAAVLGLALIGPSRNAAASHQVAIEEVLGSWQGDAQAQFVELRMLAVGQQGLSGGGSLGAAELVFDDATGSEAGRRVFVFTRDVARGEVGARVLIATRELGAVTGGLEPDFVLPAGFLAPEAGRVCYRLNAPQGPYEPTGIIDCVAYGRFSGDPGPFGTPTPITPDNRALQRVALSGQNTDDWAGTLQPTPETNAGVGVALETLCGDGLISQGEACDGAALGGETCASLGYATGKLRCIQCHIDTSRCSFCGNGAINPGEQCDGADLGGRTCGALGFTGGALTCSDRCRLSALGCDPTFYVPGGGPAGPECLAEWRVTNASGRPGVDGRAPVRQRCKDGDGGCDADVIDGTCSVTIAVCTNRNDARLARGGRPCRRAPIESWSLVAPALGAGDVDVSGLLAAVARLGTSSTAESTVTFAPPLDEDERCTEAVTLVVPTRGRRAGTLALRARTVGSGGRPRDQDALRLVCLP
jgi:hypothetical protein